MEAEHWKDGMDSVAASQPSLDDDTDRTLRGSRSDEPSPTVGAPGEPPQADEKSRSSQGEKHPEAMEEDEQSKSSQEDLFLNLAKSGIMADDAANGLSRSESKSKSERRRVSSALDSLFTWPASPGHHATGNPVGLGKGIHVCVFYGDVRVLD